MFNQNCTAKTELLWHWLRKGWPCLVREFYYNTRGLTVPFHTRFEYTWSNGKHHVQLSQAYWNITKTHFNSSFVIQICWATEIFPTNRIHKQKWITVFVAQYKLHYQEPASSVRLFYRSWELVYTDKGQVKVICVTDGECIAEKNSGLMCSIYEKVRSTDHNVLVVYVCYFKSLLIALQRYLNIHNSENWPHNYSP